MYILFNSYLFLLGLFSFLISIFKKFSVLINIKHTCIVFYVKLSFCFLTFSGEPIFWFTLYALLHSG